MMTTGVSVSESVKGNATVYWFSSPTHNNETLLLAGAGLAGATARLCTGPNCTTMVAASPAIETWEQSLKLTMPATGCGAPCYAEITTV